MHVCEAFPGGLAPAHRGWLYLVLGLIAMLDFHVAFHWVSVLTIACETQL